MPRLSGYATITDPARPLIEMDSVACCHCGSVIFVKPATGGTVYYVTDGLVWQEVPGASCYHCFKPVCLPCHEKGICTPLERRLHALEQ